MDDRPAHFDTVRVNPTGELSELVDLLARGAGLVPFEQLSESEKESDRQTARETVKMLLAMGYTIQPPGAKHIPPPVSSSPPEMECVRLNGILNGVVAPKLAELEAVWNVRNPDVWSQSVELFRRLGERILEMGEPLLAYDVLVEGLRYFPSDVCLRRLVALGLARTGAIDTANTILVKLYEDGHQDEETLGLLASTYKDLAGAAEDATRRQELLGRAQQFYARAYELTHGYWSGINVATLAVVFDEHDRAQAVARDVRATCREELKRLEENGGDPYWPLAALGEAALILGEWSAAEDWFRRAVEVAGKRFGDLHSPRRIARLLLTYLGGDRDRIEGCFRVPSVVVFAGHIVDVPGRSNPRFPAQLEPAVLESLRERLKSLNVGFGYSSVACGSDILFAESLLEAGSELHIVLPYEKEQFIKDSVEIVGAGNWGARCEAVLERATDVALASDQRLTGSTVQFEYSNLLLFGSAVARAEQLDTTLVPLAVWDGKPGDGPGGTAWTIENWRSKGLAVEIIRIDEILRSSCPNLLVHAAPLPRPVEIPSFPVLELTPAIRGLLFADAVGFSKLGEDEVARFVHHFLGLIGELAEESPHAPILKNTWGDGLFFVFPNVRHAGVFALELREAVSAVDWKEKGLPEQAMRIGVHAGPVYSCMDPVTRQRNCIGAHVSRAARIEPITPPGHVYASQAFAALAAAAGVREFRCEYVGQTSLAKHYGTFPTYVVLRRAATAEALLRFPLRDLSSTEPTAI